MKRIIFRGNCVAGSFDPQIKIEVKDPNGAMDTLEVHLNSNDIGVLADALKHKSLMGDAVALNAIRAIYLLNERMLDAYRPTKQFEIFYKRLWNVLGPKGLQVVDEKDHMPEMVVDDKALKQLAIALPKFFDESSPVVDLTSEPTITEPPSILPPSIGKGMTMRSIKKELTDLKPWVEELWEMWPNYVTDANVISANTKKRLTELMVIVSHGYDEIKKAKFVVPEHNTIFSSFEDDFVSLKSLWQNQDFSDDVGATWIGNMLGAIEHMEALDGK